ncbi:MAG: penicillin-binding protein 2 [candidate division WOR-3 bacterium]|nr:MAG: penicillin-binding protein 2 [candidate division WOR-3 bacterium]
MDENLKKFKLIRNVIVIIFIIIILSSIRLQIAEGNKYKRLSEKNRIRMRYISAPRGKIFDRHGYEISNTRPGFYVSVIQSIIDKKTLTEVSRILNLDEQTISERMSKERNAYMPVKIVHDISYEQLALLEENMDELSGIEVGVESMRNYPYGELLCHILGYVGEITDDELKNDDTYSIGDYSGKMGLEIYYEKDLRGADGIEYIEVDARGKEVGRITEKRPIPVTHGMDLYTTISLALTESVAVYLKDYEKAACVCLNPQNGEVLVLYSKPGFDPNRFIHGLQPEEWQRLYNAPDAPMYNRAIMSCYPCGSTYKPFVALAALDAHMITPEKTFERCQGEYRLGRRTFKCWKEHGKLALTNAIVHSCDIYFYQLGRFIGIDTLTDRARKIGVGEITGIDILHEKPGLLPDRTWFERRYGKYWTEGHIFNLSIGQGDLLVTPLQLACMYTVFVNNGKIPTPHLIKRDKISYRETNISTDAIQLVRNALFGVVARGTGTLAR